LSPTESQPEVTKLDKFISQLQAREPQDSLATEILLKRIPLRVLMDGIGELFSEKNEGSILFRAVNRAIIIKLGLSKNKDGKEQLIVSYAEQKKAENGEVSEGDIVGLYELNGQIYALKAGETKPIDFVVNSGVEKVTAKVTLEGRVRNTNEVDVNVVVDDEVREEIKKILKEDLGFSEPVAENFVRDLSIEISLNGRLIIEILRHNDIKMTLRNSNENALSSLIKVIKLHQMKIIKSETDEDKQRIIGQISSELYNVLTNIQQTAPSLAKQEKEESPQAQQPAAVASSQVEQSVPSLTTAKRTTLGILRWFEDMRKQRAFDRAVNNKKPQILAVIKECINGLQISNPDFEKTRSEGISGECVLYKTQGWEIVYYDSQKEGIDIEQIEQQYEAARRILGEQFVRFNLSVVQVDGRNILVIVREQTTKLSSLEGNEVLEGLKPIQEKLWRYQMYDGALANESNWENNNWQENYGVTNDGRVVLKNPLVISSEVDLSRPLSETVRVPELPELKEFRDNNLIRYWGAKESGLAPDPFGLISAVSQLVSGRKGEAERLRTITRQIRVSG